MSNIYASCSDISCGVHQLYGLASGGWAYGRRSKKKEEDCLYAALLGIARDFCKFNEDHITAKRPPCCQYVFSDVQKRGAACLARVIKRLWPQHPLFSMTGKNPNSGNIIETYLWQPDFADLLAHPRWAEALDEAQAGQGNEWYDDDDDDDGGW